MEKTRGIVLLAAGCFAFYRGWTIHTGNMALLAYGLGVLAVALGIWHLMRKAPQPRG